MMWQCDKCGRRLAAPPGRKVFCSCGSIQSYPSEAFKEAGRKAWGLIHSYPIEHWNDWDPEAAMVWYSEDWLPLIPSFGCSCKNEWAKLTSEHPPDFTSAKAFFEWTWDRHNDINRRLQHQEISIDQAYEIWSRHLEK